MSRITDQTNIWGSQGGVNAQRADLWAIDFKQVIDGINSQIFDGDLDTALNALQGNVEPYYISSVVMPCQKVKAVEVKRDSRPYMMPSFDDSLTEIRVNFILDTPTNAKTSKIYTFLETWRAFVRAGRGPMGNEKSVSLNNKFLVGFRFPVAIVFLRGNANPTVTLSSLASSNRRFSKDEVSSINQQIQIQASDPEIGGGLSQEELVQNALSQGNFDFVVNGVDNPLEDCAIFQVENMWLSSFKITDLDYSKGAEIVRIEAIFYADNILDLSNKK